MTRLQARNEANKTLNAARLAKLAAPVAAPAIKVDSNKRRKADRVMGDRVVTAGGSGAKHAAVSAKGYDGSTVYRPACAKVSYGARATMNVCYDIPGTLADVTCQRCLALLKHRSPVAG